MLNNQKGQATTFGLVLLFITVLFGSLLIKNKLYLLKKTKTISKNYLCIKKYTTNHFNHFKKIEKINKIIFILNTTKKVSFFIPGIGAVTSQTARTLEKSLIMLQRVNHFSYMKKLGSLHLKGCAFTHQIYKTPFKHLGIKLKRDVFNRVIKRRKWSTYFLNLTTRVKIKHDLSKSSVIEIF